MNNYKINKKTLALIPISNNKTKVYEDDNVIVVEKSTKRIVEESCQYYGSTYSGRKQGTINLIGVTHKSPILIEDTDNLIIFPTCSPRLKECSWVSLNNIVSYCPVNKECIVKFDNNQIIQIPVSNKILNNQVLRATRLESIINKRK